MELFVLGVVIGCLVTLGICVYELWKFKKSIFKDDEYERTLKEWQANFEELESKQKDLNLQLEQMRNILASHSYNDLLKAKSRLDMLVEEFRLEKQASRENTQRMFNDLYSLKENMKYIPKDENIY